MAANGISTSLPKSGRRDLKMALAQTKRQTVATPGYRPLNVYVSPGRKSPSPGHPWEPL
jgi:hypothetical protein